MTIAHMPVHRMNPDMPPEIGYGNTLLTMGLVGLVA